MKGRNGKTTNPSKDKENANLHERSATTVDLQEGRAKRRFPSQSSPLLITNNTRLPESVSFNCPVFNSLECMLVSRAKQLREDTYHFSGQNKFSGVSFSNHNEAIANFQVTEYRNTQQSPVGLTDC